MIPAEYSTYFVTMATVAATLFGLIFLGVSITPEIAATDSAQRERQLKALAAYVALSNPLIISLFALLPHQEVGPAVVAVSAAGLLNVLFMAVLVLRGPARGRPAIRHSLFLLVGVVLYGLEVVTGVRMLRSPTDSSALYTLGTVMIFIIIFGLARAWELVGGRHFRIRDWLSLLQGPLQPELPVKHDGKKPGKRR